MNAVADLVVEQATELDVVIRQIRFEAKNINSYELSAADGGELPPFTAGAHIDVHLESGLIRQYSLSNCPTERDRYVIAVLKDEKGRGGSQKLHETLKVQGRIRISAPRNNFKLAPNAQRAVLLAGGIGITPLKSMAHALAASGVDFELHYCARDSESIAFSRELEALQRHGKVHLHLDGGQPENGLDIKQLLATVGPDTHVYYCGPQGFMTACQAAAGHWPKGTVHFEHFKAPEPLKAELQQGQDGSFVFQIASTGQQYVVGPDEDFTEVLHAHGVVVPTSCVSGLCGTCKINYLSGEVAHNDFILDENEQKHCLTPCVSRGGEGVLVLDL